MGQIFPAFYSDIYEALSMMVNTNPQGLNIKQVACELWPNKDPDTARNTLSRALTSKNTDANLKPHEMVRLMEICGNPEHVLFFMCDQFRRERPRERERRSFERVIKHEVVELRGKLEQILSCLGQSGQQAQVDA